LLSAHGNTTSTWHCCASSITQYVARIDTAGSCHDGCSSPDIASIVVDAGRPASAKARVDAPRESEVLREPDPPNAKIVQREPRDYPATARSAARVAREFATGTSDAMKVV
jgi:hypothetical protein